MAQFKRRERKHRRLAKQDNGHKQDAQPNGNPDVILPESKAEREARRAKLAAELRAQQPPSKISSKKKKRLDKYIDTKLKKEENAELLKKLATTKVDTTLLQSSKKLGRVHETKRERLGRALQEQKAGIGSDHDAVLYEARREPEPRDEESEDEVLEDEDLAVTAAETPKPAAAFGSGLKRPLETNEAGQPVIKKRKRRKRGKPDFAAMDAVAEDDEEVLDRQETNIPNGEAGEDDDEEWSGFGSDAGDGVAIGSTISERVDHNESDEGSSSILDDTDDDDGDDYDEELESGTDQSGKESESESVPSRSEDKEERVSAFKQWADAQRNAAVEFTPSSAPTDDAAIRATFRPRQLSPDPALASMVSTQTNSERTSRPAAAITISRPEEIQAARLELPVVQEEQKIMEAIHNNPIVMVCGATGSGKTTQVPQMMFESGYGSHIGRSPANKSNGSSSSTNDPQSKGMIGITQPRRVAAMSVAERVAAEFGPAFKNRVAHQVRYDTNVSRDTAIKFMTDGILLREISQDFILSKYSAIVIDEAHERSVNTDILIGMLSRIVSLRSELAKEDPEKHYPLKLVIMSATLRVSDFAKNQRLFRNGTPPIVQAEGRQYPVTVHFARKTQRDFVTETANKVARGHRKLPPGGMLVFLTGQNEIVTVAKRLKDKLGSNTAGYISLTNGEHDDLEDSTDFKRSNDYLEGEEDVESESDAKIYLDPDKEDPEFGVPDDQPSFGTQGGVLKPHILPLYAALPSAQQLRVFQPPPVGSRLIVLATNVAETSLTIPGIRYVFDCGRSKEKRYDTATGVQTFEVDWVSKASASQRSGRAGRTGPGHCYRLYSSAVYEQYFAEHTVPEILRTPLESTVLQLKSMDIENVSNFPFPTSPDAIQLQKAERLLTNLGALAETDGRITETGREIMAYPVSPRFGKMLLVASRNDVLPYAIAAVAALAVGDLFIPEAQITGSLTTQGEDLSGSDSDRDTRAKRKAETVAQTATQNRHQAYTRAQATLSRWDDHSDVIKFLTAVAAHADESGKDKPMAAASKFCEDFYLREKGMSEVQQLRHQLHNIVSSRGVGSSTYRAYADTLSLPSEKERKVLNQIVAAGFIDQVAVRADLLKDEQTASFGRKPRRATEVPYRALIPSAEVDRSLSLLDQEMQRSIFVHPSSVLAHLSVNEMPQYIAYSHLSQAAPAVIDSTKTPRTRMHPLTTVGPKQLAALAEGTPLLEVGKPIGKIEELPDKRRQCWVSLSLRAPGGGASWPLTAWKVIQKRKRDWEIERVVAR